MAPASLIVLCPGFLSPPANLMFMNILRVLEIHNCNLLLTSAPLMAGITQRAHALRTDIINYFEKKAAVTPVVHLIGVSLGGLVCRKLAMMRDLEFEIMSITTVGTPHHGSNLASVANAFTLGLSPLLSFLPSFLNIGDGQALHDLTPRAMVEFNQLPEQGSNFFSCGAKVDPRPSCRIFKAYHIFEFILGDDHDWLVPVSSTRWVRYALHNLPVDIYYDEQPNNRGEHIFTRTGVTHLGLLVNGNLNQFGWVCPLPTSICGEVAFDAGEMYMDIARRLEDLENAEAFNELPRELE